MPRSIVQVLFAGAAFALMACSPDHGRGCADEQASNN